MATSRKAMVDGETAVATRVETSREVSNNKENPPFNAEAGKKETAALVTSADFYTVNPTKRSAEASTKVAAPMRTASSPTSNILLTTEEALVETATLRLSHATTSVKLAPANMETIANLPTPIN